MVSVIYAKKRQDLEVLSEFLVMAATLVDIKSRMLLPSNPDSEEEEEDPRAELVQQLLEYKMYKCMAYELKDRQMDAGHNQSVVWFHRYDGRRDVRAAGGRRGRGNRVQLK